MNHSKGPWTASYKVGVTRYQYLDLRDAAGFRIAEIGIPFTPDEYGDHDSKRAFEVQLANGTTLAAAPDMLDALIMALPYLETAESDPAYKPGAVAKVTKLVRDAIEKAEGRK